MIIKRKLFGRGFNIDTYNGMIQNANSTPDGQRILEGYQKKYAKEINDYKSKTALSVVPKQSSTPTTPSLPSLPSSKPNPTPTSTPKPNLTPTPTPKPNPTPTGKQPFVGIKQGAMNTWNRMGKAGKIGTVAAAAGGLYFIGKGLLGNKKKDNK